MKGFRNKYYKILSVALALVMFISGAVFAEGGLRVARISDFGGTVTVLKAGGEKEFAAFSGMSLAEGDRITTGKDSWAALQIDDDKEVKIGENTRIGVSELAGSVQSGDDRTGINLWAGKLWTSIKKALNIKSKYEIKTPTTVMGVRGTRFYTGQEGGKTIIAVVDGKVYAIAYRSEEQPDGTTLEKAIELFLEQGQQAALDESVRDVADVVVEDVTIESLDTFVLEQIQADPEGIDPALLENIEQVIEQRRIEEQQQEEEDEEDTAPPPQISYAPGTGSGSSSGGSGGGGGSGDEGGDDLGYLNNIDAFYCDGKMVFHIDFDTAIYAYVTIEAELPDDSQEVLLDDYVISNQEGGTATATITINLQHEELYLDNTEFSYEVCLTDEGGKEDDEPEYVSGLIPAISGVTLSFTQSGNVEVAGNAYSVGQVKIALEDSDHDIIFEQTPEWTDVSGNNFSCTIQDPREMDIGNGVYDIVLTLNDQYGNDFGIVIGYMIKTDYGITLKEIEMAEVIQ